MRARVRRAYAPCQHARAACGLDARASRQHAGARAGVAPARPLAEEQRLRAAARASGPGCASTVRPKGGSFLPR
eukprot:6375484-Alexandrium_andersonii.AAC.1